MEMTINVKVDVSERVIALVARLLSGRESGPEAVAIPTETAPEAAAEAVTASAPEAAAEAVTASAPKAAAAPTKPVTATPTASATVKAAKASVPTAEDVRQAMVETRKRIIGEGWDDPESDGYKFYHRTLVSMFKTTATLHGAPKPSQLAEDARQAFIDDLAQIRKDDKGKLWNGQNAPF